MTFTLAIVGRPNVGKSTLFNRLVGRKLALVDDQPGVTRDLREGDARLHDLRFTVIDTAGLEDVTDDSLQGTPHRVAKMFIKEIFSGLDPKNKPKMSVFDNNYHYDKMLVEANITFNSTCEHHFLPIFGRAHIGYISSGKVIGLSKLNRIVDYYSRRPQVQERLVMQIFNDLKESLNTENVIVVLEAKHLCVSSRGIKHESSFTSTVQYGGIFNEKENRNDFFNLIKGEK